MELHIIFGFEGSRTIECFTIQDENLYGLKDTGLEWFDKLKEGLEARDFVQSQVDPCVWHEE